MREIKFRAMHEDGTFRYFTLKDIWINGWYVSEANNDSHIGKAKKDQNGTYSIESYIEKSYAGCFHGKCKVDQFTCLLDRHGKEIFEGDVVRQGPNLFVIEFCPGGYQAQKYLELKNGATIKDSTYMISILSDEYCEIIGNIYQNPELLEPK